MHVNTIKKILKANHKIANISFKEAEYDDLINNAAEIVWDLYEWHEGVVQDYTTSISADDTDIIMPTNFQKVISASIYSSSDVGESFTILDKNEFNDKYAQHGNRSKNRPYYGKIKHANGRDYIVLECPSNSNYTLRLDYYKKFSDLSEMPGELAQCVVTQVHLLTAIPGSERYIAIAKQLHAIDLPTAIDANGRNAASPYRIDASRHDQGGSPFYVDP